MHVLPLRQMPTCEFLPPLRQSEIRGMYVAPLGGGVSQRVASVHVRAFRYMYISASKAESKRRHAWLNDGHIPDIYRVGPPHTIWEFKCYTPFHITTALGHGSHRCGATASTSDGHHFAFNNTEELLRSKVLGLAARGSPGDRPLDRRSGAGRVDAKGGDYADARSKGTTVALLATESSGALSRGHRAPHTPPRYSRHHAGGPRRHCLRPQPLIAAVLLSSPPLRHILCHCVC